MTFLLAWHPRIGAGGAVFLLNRILSLLAGGGLLAFVVWCFVAIGSQVHVTQYGLHHGGDYIAKLFPRSQADWRYALRLGPDLLQPLLETIQMAVVGTVAGMLLAFPVSFIAARTGYVPRPLIAVVKAFLNMARAVPTLIYALLVIPLAGLGAQTGAIAIGIATFISLAKLYGEALESVSVGPIEAVRSAGGNAAQVFVYAMLPQVFPLYLSTTLYSLEYNLRDSFIVGIVGAGGLGQKLSNAVNLFEWLDAGVIIALVIVLVNIVDYLSYRVRRVFS